MTTDVKAQATDVKAQLSNVKAQTSDVEAPPKEVTPDHTKTLSELILSNLIMNTNLAAQNAIANQQAMNELGIAVVGKCVNLISNTGPLEARSAVDILTQELKATIAELKTMTSAPDAAAKPATPAK